MQKEFILKDNEGNILKKTSSYVEQLKEGWIVMYKEPLKKLVMECKEYSKVRVFIYIASLQTYDTLVFVSIADVARNIGITYKTAWSCVKWLEEHQYLCRIERDGICGFLINPDFSTCGKKTSKLKKELWDKVKGGDVDVNQVQVDESKS